MSIALFANPLMMGISHTLAPKSILALKGGGYARLRREAARASFLLAIAMGLFCLALLFAGEHAMRLLYPGVEYAGNHHIVVVLGLGMLASAIGIPATYGLTSMERPQATVWAGSIGVFLTVVLVCSLMTNWGLFGAACGFLPGTVAGVVGLWVAFLTCVPPARSQQDPNADAALGHAEDTPIGAGLT